MFSWHLLVIKSLISVVSMHVRCERFLLSISHKIPPRIAASFEIFLFL